MRARFVLLQLQCLQRELEEQKILASGARKRVSELKKGLELWSNTGDRMAKQSKEQRGEIQRLARELAVAKALAARKTETLALLQDMVPYCPSICTCMHTPIDSSPFSLHFMPKVPLLNEQEKNAELVQGLQTKVRLSFFRHGSVLFRRNRETNSKCNG